MGLEGKMDAARSAADTVVDALRPGDRFALVSFDDQARVVSPGALYTGDAARLHALVAGLRDDGGTNLRDGLAAGHAELGEASGGGARKVLLVSDGNANVGETEPGAFAALARGWAAGGVTVSAVGLGRDFNETLLEDVADAGGGTYRFVGEPDELPAVIADELQRTTETVARGLRVTLRAEGGAVLHEVYGWNEGRAADGVRVDVGEIAAGQTRKIVVAVTVPADERGETHILTADLRYVSLEGEHGEASAAAAATVVDNPAAVDASADRAATIDATRARAGEIARAAADSYRNGELERAAGLLRSAARFVDDAARATGAPELVAASRNIAELEALGANEGCAYAAKAASEAGRDFAR